MRSILTPAMAGNAMILSVDGVSVLWSKNIKLEILQHCHY
jgi:hypothetical protein